MHPIHLDHTSANVENNSVFAWIICRASCDGYYIYTLQTYSKNNLLTWNRRMKRIIEHLFCHILFTLRKEFSKVLYFIFFEGWRDFTLENKWNKIDCADESRKWYYHITKTSLFNLLKFCEIGKMVLQLFLWFFCANSVSTFDELKWRPYRLHAEVKTNNRYLLMAMLLPPGHLGEHIDGPRQLCTMKTEKETKLGRCLTFVMLLFFFQAKKNLFSSKQFVVNSQLYAWNWNHRPYEKEQNR